MSDFHIRPYTPADRPAVRALCADTGFLGQPIDPVFQDRELFADFLTSYYTDHEPENAFVIEIAGHIRGYLLGSRRRFHLQIPTLRDTLRHLALLLLRYPRYNPASRRYIHWLLLHGWRETPPAPRDSAHLHLNLLPQARSVKTCLAFVNHFLDHLRSQGETRVYGQIATYGHRRSDAVWQRLGFTIHSRREITKYRRWRPDPIYLTTIVCELPPANPSGAPPATLIRSHFRHPAKLSLDTHHPSQTN